MRANIAIVFATSRQAMSASTIASGRANPAPAAAGSVLKATLVAGPMNAMHMATEPTIDRLFFFNPGAEMLVAAMVVPSGMGEGWAEAVRS